MAEESGLPRSTAPPAPLGPAPAVTATPSPPSLPPRPGPLHRLLGVLGRLFPADSGEPQRRTGYVSDSRRDLSYLLVAAAIAIGLAVLWSWIVRVQPVPPGGDPSTWLLTSYSFLGLPSTPGVQPLAYPPLAFPFVGLSVVLGGGPLVGGRIYMAAAIAVLGVAIYVFGRSVLERPSLALVLEGLWLAEPDFQQLYYFGGYPNIFSLIFLLLSVAFLTRYLRSRRPLHLLLFWVFATVCVLSHSLTGAVLGGILAVLAVFLVLVGRLPRTMLFSRAGGVGAAILAGGTLAYYGGTAALGIAHPSYLESTPLSISKTQLLPTVLRPFYITSVPQWITGSTVSLSPTVSLGILVAASLGIGAAVLALRVLRPAWLTTPWLTLAAMMLTVFVIALIAYALSIQLDYRRLPYFLYGPAIAAVLFPVDLYLSNRMSRPPAPREVEPKKRWARLAYRHPRLRRWRRWVDPVIVVAGLLLLTAVVQVVTVPSGTNYESFYTLYAHDQSFLSAVNAISNSGIDGSVIATTPYVAHWPSTITNTRTTYVPSLSNGNAYAASHVQDGETTSVSLAGRYTVTNSLVGATIPGVRPGDFNSSPIFCAFAGNVYQPVLQLVANSLVVGVAGGTPVALSPAGSAAPPLGVVNGGTGFAFQFVGPGFVLNETVTAEPASASVLIALTATANATSPLLLTSIGARLATLPLVASTVFANGPGAFVWNSSGRAGALSTTGSVTPTSALSSVIRLNQTPGAAPTVVLRLNSSNPAGSPVLAFSLLLSTPGASNFLTSFGPFLDTAVVWTNWTARFILYYQGQPPNPVLSPYYLSTEYGATVYAASGSWTVYLLPLSVVPATSG